MPTTFNPSLFHEREKVRLIGLCANYIDESAHIENIIFGRLVQKTEEKFTRQKKRMQ